MCAGSAELALAASERVNLILHPGESRVERRRLYVKTALHGGVDCFRSERRKHDFRPPPDRTRHDGNRLEYVVLAVPAYLLAGVERDQQVQAFVELFTAGGDWYAHAGHLVGKSPSTDTENQAAIAKDVRLNARPGECSHIVQRQHTHGSDELDMAGDRGDLHCHLQWIRHEQNVDQVMLGDRDAAVPEPVDELRLLDHVGIESVPAIADVRVVG